MDVVIVEWNCVAVVVVEWYCIVWLWSLWSGIALCGCGRCGVVLHCVDVVVTGLYWTVVTLDIFQTGVTAVRWPKWFTENGQRITVTSWIAGRPYYYQSCTSKHPAPLLA